MKTKNACASLKHPEKLNHQLLGASLKSPGRVIFLGIVIAGCCVRVSTEPGAGQLPFPFWFRSMEPIYLPGLNRFW